MAVRPIDANAMLNELRPVSFEAEHSAVLLSDVSKMMREWVERQPTLTPPNELLTLEQLREMDGEPVWVKVFGPTDIRCDGWCEVEVRDKNTSDEIAYVWWAGSEVEDIGRTEDYGKTWIAYRRPPERQENNNDGD